MSEQACTSMTYPMHTGLLLHRETILRTKISAMLYGRYAVCKMHLEQLLVEWFKL